MYICLKSEFIGLWSRSTYINRWGGLTIIFGECESGELEWGTKVGGEELCQVLLRNVDSCKAFHHLTSSFMYFMSGSLSGSVFLPLMLFHHSLNDYITLKQKIIILRMCFQESCSLVNLQLCFWRVAACLGGRVRNLLLGLQLSPFCYNCEGHPAALSRVNSLSNGDIPTYISLAGKHSINGALFSLSLGWYP